MGIFDLFRGKGVSKKEPLEKIEVIEGGSNFEERTGPFGERVIRGEHRRVTYEGTSEEIKQMISKGDSNGNRYIEGGRGSRRLRSASDEED